MPMVLLRSASKPSAVLLPPVVFSKSARITVGRVPDTGGVVLERCNTVGRVEDAGGVAEKRPHTVGRVVAAGGVARERFEHRWPC